MSLPISHYSVLLTYKSKIQCKQIDVLIIYAIYNIDDIV